jgi:hypothetical protein
VVGCSVGLIVLLWILEFAGRCWGELSKTRYKHIPVRLFRAIHGPLQFWKALPNTRLLWHQRFFKVASSSERLLITADG